MKLIKGVLYVLSVVWCLFSTVFTIESVQEGTVTKLNAKHKKEKESDFIPAITYLTAYRSKHNNTLPSQDDYYWWGRNHYGVHFNQNYSPLHKFEGIQEISHIPNNLQQDKEFIIYQWNGDSYDFYTSWNNHFSLDDFEKETGKLYYLYSFLTSIIPLGLLLSFDWLIKLRTPPNSPRTNTASTQD